MLRRNGRQDDEREQRDRDGRPAEDDGAARMGHRVGHGFVAAPGSSRQRITTSSA